LEFGLSVDTDFAEALIIWRLSSGGGSIAKDRFFAGRNATPISYPVNGQEMLYCRYKSR